MHHKHAYLCIFIYSYRKCAVCCVYSENSNRVCPNKQARFISLIGKLRLKGRDVPRSDSQNLERWFKAHCKSSHDQPSSSPIHYPVCHGGLSYTSQEVTFFLPCSNPLSSHSHVCKQTFLFISGELYICPSLPIFPPLPPITQAELQYWGFATRRHELHRPHPFPHTPLSRVDAESICGAHHAQGLMYSEIYL